MVNMTWYTVAYLMTRRRHLNTSDGWVHSPCIFALGAPASGRHVMCTHAIGLCESKIEEWVILTSLGRTGSSRASHASASSPKTGTPSTSARGRPTCRATGSQMHFYPLIKCLRKNESNFHVSDNLLCRERWRFIFPRPLVYTVNPWGGFCCVWTVSYTHLTLPTNREV